MFFGNNDHLHLSSSNTEDDEDNEFTIKMKMKIRKIKEMIKMTMNKMTTRRHPSASIINCVGICMTYDAMLTRHINHRYNKSGSFI